ncbi:DUF5011 domain-containing protein, partial [Gammaproteobacteria bacterium]|nr:DUF5011 domain-containing protein [Gammaproteobacteria bacterium]
MSTIAPYKYSYWSLENKKMIPINKFRTLLFALLAILLVTPASAADDLLTDKRLNEINERVSSMNYRELVSARSSLQQELVVVEDSVENTQSPASNKSLRQRIAEINAELSAIQKVLVGMVAVGAVSALTDDGYNDNVPPVITVLGDNPTTVELGTSYTDAGATAMDAFHGNTNVVSTGTVDTNTVGTYTITYTATDLDNNTSTATRTVNVVDTTAPVVTVTGDNPATVELGTSYTDAGATATDASGDVTVVTSGDTVDADTLGSYTITYTSTDASGNSGTATRVVNVVDTTAPVFTSSSTFVIDEGDTDVGTVTATDIQAVTFSIVSDVLSITSAGVLTIDLAASDYEAQSDNPVTLPYDGSTYDI